MKDNTINCIISLEKFIFLKKMMMMILFFQPMSAVLRELCCAPPLTAVSQFTSAVMVLPTA